MRLCEVAIIWPEIIYDLLPRSSSPWPIQWAPVVAFAVLTHNAPSQRPHAGHPVTLKGRWFHRSWWRCGILGDRMGVKVEDAGGKWWNMYQSSLRFKIMIKREILFLQGCKAHLFVLAYCWHNPWIEAFKKMPCPCWCVVKCWLLLISWLSGRLPGFLDVAGYQLLTVLANMYNHTW